MGTAEASAQPYDRGVYHYFYRKPGQREWLELSTYNVMADTGFLPIAGKAE